MKLVSKEAGQSLQLFIAEEIRPERGIYFPTLISKVASRYSFAVLPSSDFSEIAENNAVKFQTGYLPHNPEIVIRNLDIYGDGIIVTAYDTDVADIILSDVIEWTANEFKFREPRK